MGNRSRLTQYTGVSGVPLGVTLNPLPFNATLRQMLIRLENSTLTQYDVFTISKMSGVDADYDFPIVKYIPTIDDSYETMWQEINIDFLRNDYLAFGYANIDGLDIFVECIFMEAD